MSEPSGASPQEARGSCAVTVRVRYFALLRERFDVSEELVTLREASFDALLAQLRTRHGAVVDALEAPGVRIAVKDEAGVREREWELFAERARPSVRGRRAEEQDGPAA
ncbi:MAG: hypothetical protein AAF684_06920 [Pseudomonadota bacterium]